MSDERYLKAHRAWIGALQPVGLVVSPIALNKAGAELRENVAGEQDALGDLLADRPAGPSLAEFVTRVLDWRATDLVPLGGEHAPHAEHEHYLESEGEALRPSAVVFEDKACTKALLYAAEVAAGADFDAVSLVEGWKASPHQRLERLMRGKRIEIGLLFNARSLRLLYAPNGESSGHVSFPFSHLETVGGRPAFAALLLLLGPDRLWTLPTEKRLPALLRQSRAYQNEVSTRLAEQVFEALQELVRGFQRAAEGDPERSLEEARRADPDHVYGGLLTVLMRSVFLLYAEERDLLPQGAFGNHYALGSLFTELRQDAALHPDVMDDRYGAWARLLSLFRMLHDGARREGVALPPRYGKLFDPDAYPFLEGRRPGDLRRLADSLEAPKVSDGVVLRVLENLLILDGERLSYRALDVEQIGSVYEAMMGYRLEVATGQAIALMPKHVVVDLDALLAAPGKDRAKLLQEATECKLATAAAAKAKSAETVEELVAALGRRVSPRTPNPLARGNLYLQPTEERRRSGSHYTPRALTAPIVEKTLDPQLARLGTHPTPEQILDLKVCDPAMGSGAFLVEACRFLGEKLVASWTHYKSTPRIPPDEDPLLHAQRLIAQRALYGVDKNPFAVDLAKLSLWLATLAKDHPFTFLDHALRHGDSLVGVDRAQLVAFDWSAQVGETAQVTVLSDLLAKRLRQAEQARAAIHALSDSDDVLQKKDRFNEAEAALKDLRLIGDVLISVFFDRDTKTAREALRKDRAAAVLEFASHGRGREPLEAEAQKLRDHAKPIPPFHWQIEFPEVFSRTNGGFDAFVGNPPFAGKNTLIDGSRDGFVDWLKEIHEGSHGNSDLVAHFFRRAFVMLRENGSFGLVATKTIAQGDTRTTGLGWICKHGGTIYSAERRMKWPGVAAVVVSFVHIQRGTPPPPFRLDEREVPRISIPISRRRQRRSSASRLELRKELHRQLHPRHGVYIRRQEHRRGDADSRDASPHRQGPAQPRAHLPLHRRRGSQ